MTEEKFAKSERYESNGKHFHHNELVTWLSVLAAAT